METACIDSNLQWKSSALAALWDWRLTREIIHVPLLSFALSLLSNLAVPLAVPLFLCRPL